VVLVPFGGSDHIDGKRLRSGLARHGNCPAADGYRSRTCHVDSNGRQGIGHGNCCAADGYSYRNCCAADGYSYRNCCSRDG
jgi:hypothetical protein